jgi:hypothetical protein
MIQHQIRLLRKYLEDDYLLMVFDNSSDRQAEKEIWSVCGKSRTPYVRVVTDKHLHYEALEVAAIELLERDPEIIGFLDHDIYPTRSTRIAPLLSPNGFYGIGQRHAPTNQLYLWPGFCFLSTRWLASKSPLTLNFDGIRGAAKADDGDCGSMNAPLFANEDWERLYAAPHGYKAIRTPDSVGLQSWGIETMGDWVHLSNGSGWMAIPEPEERDRIVIEMLEAM